LWIPCARPFFSLALVEFAQTHLFMFTYPPLFADHIVAVPPSLMLLPKPWPSKRWSDTSVPVSEFLWTQVRPFFFSHFLPAPPPPRGPNVTILGHGALGVLCRFFFCFACPHYGYINNENKIYFSRLSAYCVLPPSLWSIVFSYCFVGLLRWFTFLKHPPHDSTIRDLVVRIAASFSHGFDSLVDLCGWQSGVDPMFQ